MKNSVLELTMMFLVVHVFQDQSQLLIEIVVSFRVDKAIECQ